MKNDSRPRPYRQTARAKAAAETAERVLSAFIARMESCWFDEIRLEDVASDAGVTVQTVIRRFGGKEGLLEAGQALVKNTISTARQIPAGDVAKAIDVVITEYESLGNLVIRLLAQEERYAPIKVTTDIGRAYHREWVGSVFAPWLDAMPSEQRSHAHDRLVIALDVYVWKLVRMDMRRTKAELCITMSEMCAGALGVTPETLKSDTTHSSETIHV
jgi:AcrR family transcriptional regulator